MHDEAIIELYFARNEAAISATDEKYGRLCHTVALNVLRSEGDADECVNDAYHKAWMTIPPTHPKNLKAFIARITRNTAIDRYRERCAEKRAAETELCLDEFIECLPSESAQIDESLALTEAINAFLAALPKRTRTVFVMRYWYLSEISEIAKAHGMRESAVKVSLMRTRNALRDHLIKEELFL